jgi:thiol-disulfide isomerase/thioredoxin
MKKILITLAIIFTTLTLNAKDSGEHKMVATDIDGNKLHITGTKSGLIIDEYKGKVIFLEYFGHQCPPCMATIPHYIELTDKYKDKLQIIAIEAQGYDDEQLKKFREQKKINYELLSTQGAGELYQYVSGRAGWRGAIPFLVAIDPKGNVKFIRAGFIPESDLKTLVEKLIN